MFRVFIDVIILYMLVQNPDQEFAKLHWRLWRFLDKTQILVGPKKKKKKKKKNRNNSSVEVFQFFLPKFSEKRWSAESSGSSATSEPRLFFSFTNEKKK